MFPGLIDRLESTVAVLAGGDVVGFGQGDTLLGLLGLQARLDAEIARRLHAFMYEGEWAADGAATPAGWIRFRNNCSRSEINERVRVADAVSSMPITEAAWVDGGLTSRHVSEICRVRRVAQADEYFSEYEPVLVEAARSLTPEEVRVVGQRWIDALNDYLDRDGANKPETDPSVRDHSAHFSITKDGVGVLDATFDAEGAVIVQKALDRAYETGHRADDPRLPAAQRADAIIEICEKYLAGMPASGNRPHVMFVNDLDDYQGLVFGRAETSTGTPMSSETIRRFVCNSDLSVLTIKDGVPLNLGRTERLFSKYQNRVLAHRDGGCRGPGCDAPVSRCEAHHLTPWTPAHPDDPGGPTDLSNGIMACRGHCHRQLHEGGWQVTGDANGTLTFTTRDRRLVGTSNPRNPDLRYLTQQGEEHALIQQRIQELKHQIQQQQRA